MCESCASQRRSAKKFPAIGQCVHAIPLSDVPPDVRNQQNLQTRGPTSIPTLSFLLPTSNTLRSPNPSSFQSVGGARQAYPSHLHRLSSLSQELPTHPSAVGFSGSHPGLGSISRIAFSTPLQTRQASPQNSSGAQAYPRSAASQ